MLVHRPSTVREWVLRALGFKTERWAVVARRLGITQIRRVTHRVMVRLKWAARPVPADVVVPTHGDASMPRQDADAIECVQMTSVGPIRVWFYRTRAFGLDMARDRRAFPSLLDECRLSPKQEAECDKRRLNNVLPRRHAGGRP